MNDKILKEFDFDYGFNKTIKILFNKKNVDIILTLEADYKEDGIEEEQKQAYCLYKKYEKEIFNKIENQLKKSDTDNLDRFTPTRIVIERKGTCALLLEDDNDTENGKAIVFNLSDAKNCYDIKILTQDEYL